MPVKEKEIHCICVGIRNVRKSLGTSANMNLTWEFQICVSSLSLVDFLTTLHPPHQYSVPVRCIFGDFANIKLSSENHWERQQIWTLIGSFKFILCFITYGFWQLCTPPTNVKSRSDSDLVTLPILNCQQNIIGNIFKYGSALVFRICCFIICVCWQLRTSPPTNMKS